MLAVKRLRSALKMSQAQFAALIERSHQSVAMYEAEVPDDMLELFADLAASKNLVDLAAEFAAELQQRRSGGRAVSVLQKPRDAAPDSTPAAFDPAHENWHNVLEEVLRSRNQQAIGAVTQNLEVFGEFVRIKKEEPALEKPAKRARRA